jgi:hypothetical protein
MTEKKSFSKGSGFWQIIFPSAVLGILIILISIGVALGVGDKTISRFAEISTILLVLPVLFISLILLVILVGSIVLIGKLIYGIPPITQRILDFLTRIERFVKRLSRIIVRPVIRPSALLGSFRNIIIRNGPRYRIE